jgi:drug/metabolite transporter (DMT)-like permease
LSSALALGGTTLAYICYYWLITHVGATRTLIVTYLLPCTALIYGALLLQEPIGINAIGGLALILTGIFFAGKKTEQKKVAETPSPEFQTQNQSSGQPDAYRSDIRDINGR